MNRTERRAEAKRTRTPFLPLIFAPTGGGKTNAASTFSPAVPDPALKGVKGKNCNRMACQKAGAVFYNRATQKYYCPGCACRINECPTEDGVPLCSRDEEAVHIYRALR